MFQKLIYLIDDDKVSNFISTKTLDLQPFQKTVKTFENGRLAMDALENELNSDIKKIYDELIIFLDINMPVMNGWEFLDSLDQGLLESLIPVRLVMLTSSIDQEDLNISRKYKIVKDFIVKPLTAGKIEFIFPEMYFPKND